MPLIDKLTSQSFHLFLYAGQMGTVTLLKRGNDQREGTVTAYTLYECRRSNYTKEGEPLQGDLAVGSATSWQIPATQLRRVGVNYINVLDRIIDQLNMWWQPEAGQDILLSQFDSHYWIRCLRVDPSPNAVALGIPEWTQFPFTNP